MSHSNLLKKSAKRQFSIIGSFVGVEDKQAFVSYAHKNQSCKSGRAFRVELGFGPGSGFTFKKTSK